MNSLTATTSNVFVRNQTKRIIIMNLDSLGDQTYEYTEYLRISRRIIRTKYLEISHNLPTTIYEQLQIELRKDYDDNLTETRTPMTIKQVETSQ